MPFFTLTIEDYSPFITYSGTDWTPETSQDFSESSYQLTNKSNAYARIVFNGTGIDIYGVKRPEHGMYQVVLDGTNSGPLNGSADSIQFKQNLFSNNQLEQATHTVEIANQDDGHPFSIDWITIRGNIGANTTGTLYVINYQDSDSNFSYQPASQWSDNPDNGGLDVGTFFGSSGHWTRGSQASFDFSFKASNGVSLYGPLSTNGAPYTVSLDGAPGTTYQSSSNRYLPQSLLFHATNIGAGQHNLKVTCSPTANNQVFAVDYANVYTDNPDLVPGASTSSSGGSSSKSSGLSNGAAAGIGVAASLIAALFAVLMFLLLMRRKRRQAEMDMKETSGLINPYPNRTGAQQSAMVTPSTHVFPLSKNYAPGVAPIGYPVASGSESDYTAVPSDSGASSSNPSPLRYVADPANGSSDGVVGMYRDLPSLAPARKIQMDAGDTRRTEPDGTSPPGYSM